MIARTNQRAGAVNTTSTIVVAGLLVVAAAAAFWLWRGYLFEKQLQDHILTIEGQTTLELLQTGLRFHCPMQPTPHDYLSQMLAEYATAPRVRGLSIMTAGGQTIARSGEMPPDIAPPESPPENPRQILRLDGPAGVIFARIANIHPPRPGTPDAPPAAERDPRLQKPVWLAVLLDTSEYMLIRAASARRFTLSVAITSLAAILAIAIAVLVLRQNRLAAQLAARNEHLRELEERALLGAGLAHETKNPLGIIRGLAQSLLDRHENPAQRAGQCANLVIDEVDRVVGRINSFLEYSRAAAPEPAPIALHEETARTVAYFADEAKNKGIRIHTQLAPTRALADPRMVRQIVVNLLANAVAACNRGDHIHVRLSPASRREWLLEVADTGPGIPLEDIPRVVQPYFSRREGGTGLGLAIVNQIARAHGWKLQIQSPPGKGASITIAGPASTEEN